MIEFTFHGEPVPAQRTRSSNGRHYTPEKYAEYKKALAAALHAEYGYYAWDIPTQDEPSKRRKWMQANRYNLKVHAYMASMRGDWDNIGKSISDAIEQAGIIANDCQIDKATVERFQDKKNPRVEFWLERIGNGNKAD